MCMPRRPGGSCCLAPRLSCRPSSCHDASSRTGRHRPQCRYWADFSGRRSGRRNDPSFPTRQNRWSSCSGRPITRTTSRVSLGGRTTGGTRARTDRSQTCCWTPTHRLPTRWRPRHRDRNQPRQGHGDCFNLSTADAVVVAAPKATNDHGSWLVDVEVDSGNAARLADLASLDRIALVERGQ